MATFNDMLVSCSSKNKEAIILRNFNVNHVNDGQDKESKDTFLLHGYKQIIKKVTHATNDSSPLIDLIPTNNPISISKCDIFPMGIGDHVMVRCIRKINNLKFTPKIITCRNYSSYSTVR